MPHAIEEILISTASTVISAALGAFLFALLKSIRLCIRLRRVSAIVQAVRNKSYKGFRNDSDMSLCDQAKQEVDDVLADIEKEAEGIFHISRPFSREIQNLKSDISDVKDTVFAEIFFRSLGYHPHQTKALEASRTLSRRINRISLKALSPLNFLLP